MKSIFALAILMSMTLAFADDFNPTVIAPAVAPAVIVGGTVPVAVIPGTTSPGVILGSTLPAVFTTIIPGEELTDEELAEEEADSEDEEGGFDLGKVLSSMGSALGGGGGGNGSAGGARSGKANGGAGTGSMTVETAALENCGTPPANVQTAISETLSYRQSCNVANRGDSQKIVINDYSGSSGGMYIFDSSGACLFKTAVTYGGGGTANMDPPKPCSEGSSNFTPPGYHLTGKNTNDGAKYNSSNSLRMYSLQGQGSSGRGVLIHSAAQPGTGTSLGCSGVGCFSKVMQILGSGALVNNYFGDKGAAPGCNNSAGMHGDTKCELEGGNAAIPPGVTDVGGGSVDDENSGR